MVILASCGKATDKTEIPEVQEEEIVSKYVDTADPESFIVKETGVPEHEADVIYGQEIEQEVDVDESELTTMIVTGENVNVRTSPSTDSEVYTKLARRTEVQVIEKGAEWAKVYMDGKIFYVASQFVREPSDKVAGFTVCIDAGHQATERIAIEYLRGRMEKFSSLHGLGLELILAQESLILKHV